MTKTARRPMRRALAVPASIAILAGAAATSTGLLSPQRASAISCPVLATSPQTYSTGEHCFTVPANVTVITAVLKGGTGGDGVAGDSGNSPGLAGLGGHGMQVSGNVTVAAGDVIWVYVGGNGTGVARAAPVASTAAPVGPAASTRSPSPAAEAVPPTCAPRRQPRRSRTAAAAPAILRRGRPARSSWRPAVAAAVATVATQSSTRRPVWRRFAERRQRRVATSCLNPPPQARTALPLAAAAVDPAPTPPVVPTESDREPEVTLLMAPRAAPTVAVGARAAAPVTASPLVVAAVATTAVAAARAATSPLAAAAAAAAAATSTPQR